MKKKQKIKGYIWFCGWKHEASHAQALKAAKGVYQFEHRKRGS